MKYIPQLLLVILCLLVYSCIKETSLEGRLPDIPPPIDTSGTDTTGPVDIDTMATFTLVSTNNNCSNATVSGSFVMGQYLTEFNKVTLDVDVTYPGQWIVFTETVNGISFADAGIFTETGKQTITLLGAGTPGEFGTVVIPVTVGNTTCSFPVTIEEN